MKRIYLDYAATTPCDDDVRRAMMPYFEEHFGNPSGLYAEGRVARQAVDDARDRVAAAIGATSTSEIIFTGSGSEADNLALQGVAWEQRLEGRGAHLLVSAIEHSAVLQTAHALARQGFSVTLLPVDAQGRVDPETVREALRDDTILVSVMHANNEIGTIQPIAEIAAICRDLGVPFHTDAVQTVGQLPIDVEELGVDLLTLSAHKVYGPKGVGALYVRRGVPLAPHTYGGAQERERRAGTENVAGIVGMALALEKAVALLPTERERLTALRNRLIAGILEKVEGAQLNGHPTERLPGNANFSFEDVDGESLLLRLDLEGVAASSGSACSAGSIEPSHVLTALGLSPKLAKQALRLSLGRGTTEDEIDQVLQLLPRLIERLRRTG